MIFCMDSTAGTSLCWIAGLVKFKSSGAVLIWELQARKMEGEGNVIFLLVVMWLLQIPDVAPQKRMGHFSRPRRLLCAICPRSSWCRGSVKCVTPFILLGGQGCLPYRKCLVSVQPAQRLFYSCLAIHLPRCLRLLALVTVWGMQALRLWCTVICCLYVSSLSFWG